MNRWFFAVLVPTLFILLQAFSPHTAAGQSTPHGSRPGKVLGESNHRQFDLSTGSKNLQTLEMLQAAPGEELQYRVRIVYAVPENRSAQPEAEENLAGFVRKTQEWFADNMELMGYGRKTFVYETESASDDALIHQVELNEPDTFFHGSALGVWGSVFRELESAGLPVFQTGELWGVVPEIHVQEPDGRLREGTQFFGGAGLPFAGVGMVAGDALARIAPRYLTDDRLYGGIVVPGIGPYPLAQGVTFPWFELDTLSTVGSSAFGAFAHELGHGLGLWHDFRNDANFNGNLMGNGLRGIRGALFPGRYPDNGTRLSPASALLLNYSRFFNGKQTFTDDSAPFAEILTGSSVQPEDGLCKLRFRASDEGSGLGGVVLIRAGEVAAEKPLSGTLASGTIATYNYTPGVADEWLLVVTDRQGNRSDSLVVNVTCAAGHNRAPVPFIQLSKSQLKVGEKTILDARSSFDPDGRYSALAAQWDLDGDGDFDTEPSTAKHLETSYSKPGIYRVIARLIDEEGDWSLSNPIGIRVQSPKFKVRIDIKPGDPLNVVNPFSHGELWVSLLSDDQFDALQTDISKVRFGAGEAAVLRHEVRDVNRDGASDLVLRFRISEVGIRCADGEISLMGETYAGVPITGTDSVNPVGCKKK